MGVRICLGCMREMAEEQPRCPYCGFAPTDPHPPQALPLKTVLNDRYVIGKPLKVDGEGISYIAYDVEENAPAMIREYLPVQMVERQPDGDLRILSDYLAQYKALLSDFQELYASIMSWKSMNHIRKVYDLFTANHTIYAVSRYEKGMTLQQFLECRGGKLSWNEAKRLFDPMLAELEMIHRSKFLHRGISPNSLLITDDGLVLIAFSICSAKSLQSELEPSMPDGYAAPEQYSVSPQGEWTDVYALSAVLYRVLTGEQPPSAQHRAEHPWTALVQEKNPGVPQIVADAIRQGLSLSISERFQSVHELRAALDGRTPDGKTKEHPVVHPYYREELPAVEQEAEEDEDDLPEEEQESIIAKILIRSIPIIVIVCVILYQLMIGFPFLPGSRRHHAAESEPVSQTELSSPESEEALSKPESKPESQAPSKVEKVSVPQFIGSSYASINTSAYALTFAQPKYEYSDAYAQGVVCDQSLSMGEAVLPQTSITLTVSLGSKWAVVPDAKNYTSEQYQNLLSNKYHLPYTVRQDYSDEIAAGYLISISPSAGNQVDRTSQEGIVLTESLGPKPQSEEPNTVG